MFMRSKTHLYQRASTLEVTGNKVVLQATDVLKIDCDVGGKIDATLSIMEIT